MAQQPGDAAVEDCTIHPRVTARRWGLAAACVAFGAAALCSPALPRAFFSLRPGVARTSSAVPTVDVVSAIYGTPETNHVCDATRSVAQYCSGGSRCVVSATDDLCGDPDYGVRKRLTLQFRCAGGLSRSVVVPETGSATLECQGRAPQQRYGAALFGPAATTPPVQIADRSDVGQKSTAAWAADKAQDYATAAPLFQAIDAEADTVPSTASGDPGRDGVAFWQGIDLSAARRMLGWYYQTGRGVAQDYAMAAQYYRKADETIICSPGRPAARSWNKPVPAHCDSGDTISEDRLGELYAYGLGVPQDRAQARQLWSQSAGHSDQLAINLLDLLEHDALPQTNAEIDSIDIPGALDKARQATQANDDVAARRYLRLAADFGSGTDASNAKLELGLLHLHGQGGPRDEAEAFRLIGLASDSGNAQAKRNLALLYLNGTGTAADPKQARDLMQQAADAGSPEAQAWIADKKQQEAKEAEREAREDAAREAREAKLWAEQAARDSAEQARRRAAWKKLSLNERQTRCEQPCQSEEQSCHNRNQSNGWATMAFLGFSLSSLMVADMNSQDCSSVGRVCRRSCVAGE